MESIIDNLCTKYQKLKKKEHNKDNPDWFMRLRDSYELKDRLTCDCNS